MDNYEVLLAIDNVLSVKSSAVLRTVSKITKQYITPKKYSFYKFFKQLNFDKDLIIKMLFNSDPVFIKIKTEYYFPIEYHKYGNQIKEYVLNTVYYWCIQDFSETLADFEYENYGYSLIELIKEHCEIYCDYSPLLNLLIQLCYEEYNPVKIQII